MSKNIFITNLKKSSFIILTATLVISGFFVSDALALTSITVTSPTGGEYWSGIQEITWTAEPGDDVNIYCITADTDTSVKIAGNVECGLGSYSWDTRGASDGDYRIKVTDSNDSNVWDTSGVFTIDNTNPEIAFHDNITGVEATGPDGAPVTYDNPTAIDLIDGEVDVVCNPASGSTFPLGDTTVNCSAIDKAGNTGTSNFKIQVVDTTPPDITLIDPDSITLEYGSTYVDAGAMASDLVDGDLTSSIVVNNPVDTFTLGTYIVTYNVSDAALNPAIEVTRTVNVVERPITVTADAKSKTYGDADPSLTYQITSGTLVDAVDLTGNLTRDTGNDVGTYAIIQGTLALTDNYTLTYEGANLTIDKKIINVTAEAKERIYGEVDPDLTFVYTPELITGDSFSGALTRDTGENVGTYAITQNTLALSSNYTLNYTGADLTITKKPLTVTAVSDIKEYDATTNSGGVPSITSGTLATGDTATWTQSFDSKDVGTNKSLIPAGLVNDGNSGNNYTVTFANDTSGVITAFSITASITADNKTYDGTTGANTVCSLNGVIGSDNVTCAFSSANFDDKNIGTGKTVTATGLTLSGTDAGNYTVNDTATTQADILIRDLTVTATAENKTYDSTDNVTISLSTDKVSSDEVIANFITASFFDENVGENKVVSVSGITISGADAGNYNLINTSVSTNADITALSVTGTITANDKTYDGTTGANTVCSLNGVIGSDNVTCAFSSANFDDKNIGTGKTVTATGLTLSGTDAGNYTVNDTATTQADILIRDLTVTAVSDTKEYDATTNSGGVPSITSGTLATGDTATWTQSFDSKDVGTNKSLIPAGSVNDGNSGNNYAVTFANDTTGVIEAKDITIIPDPDQNKAYGEADLVIFTYTFAPDLETGDSFTGALSREIGEDIGIYTYTLGDLSAGDNYSLVLAPGTFEITVRPIIVTADDYTREYGTNDPDPLTYTYAPELVGNDAFTGALTRVAGEDVGTYVIIQGDLALSSNYNLIFVAGTLTIEDTTVPVIEYHADVVDVEATSPDGATVTYTNPTATDLVDGSVEVTCSPISGSTFALGKTTVNCIATDAAGNTGTSSFNVQVVDTTPPEIIDTPEDITGVEATSPDGATVTYTNPTATDLVDGVVVATCSPASGSTFALDIETTVTCSATDSHGIVAVPTTFTVTVEDTTAPVIAAHIDITEEATSPDGAVVTYTAPNSTDAVDGVVVATCSPASGSTFALDIETTVTCSATDSHGIVAVPTTFTVTVEDTTAPEIAAHDDITAEATSPAGAVVDYTNPTATDLVDDDVNVVCDPASGSTFVLGDTTVTCTAIDVAGNTEASSFLISVVDTTPPTIASKEDITAEATSPDGAIIEYTSPTATDLVDDDVNVVCDPASGSLFPLGDTTVTCSATDIAGNTGTSSFVIEVVDTTPPEITNLTPSHTSVTSDATPTISAEFIEDGSGINVDSIIITIDYREDKTDYATKTTNNVIYTPVIPLSAGTYIVTVDVADMAGNSAIQASWSFIVNPSIATITVSSDKASLPADGSTQAKITAQLLDNGVPIVGATVNFTSTLGDITDLDETDANGRAIAILTSNEAGQTTVTASYNSNSGLVSGTVNVIFTEVITDITPVPLTTYDILLSKGWNLVSLPLIPDSTAIGDVLAGISSNIDVVKYYDASTGTWLSYKPDIGGTLSIMKDGKGYWIYMDEADTLTVNGVEMPGPAEILPVYPVAVEWNLIGFKSVNSMKSSAYLSGVSYIRVYGYDEDYFTVIDKDMKPGLGYWLYADAAGNIVP